MARRAGGGGSAEVASSPSVVSSSRHLPREGEDWISVIYGRCSTNVAQASRWMRVTTLKPRDR
ncbi:hypothetical protein CA606_20245 [Caulobacter vibrioides]|uniref:Uncharacterized protein n=1 Tax=Caulobacter vibrioides TaxID=155892 RepID=A0A2S1B7M0_CAUVI|nr:hypothetical protein CA606_20245 [Caulobacter vibrioides]